MSVSLQVIRLFLTQRAREIKMRSKQTTRQPEKQQQNERTFQTGAFRH